MAEKGTKNIATALLKAQMEMGDAKKSSQNPYFKSSYADLNAVREACIPILNKHGIVVLQPMVRIGASNFVKTLLLHESGEELESVTEIIIKDLTSAQAQGSGITYARRYGLQAFINVGAVDDDGAEASKPKPKPPIEKKWLNIGDPQFEKIKTKLIEKTISMDEVKSFFNLSKTTELELQR